jgi:protein involved in polysaccharide export with SLBB domain
VLLVSPRRLAQVPSSDRIAFSLENKSTYLDRIDSVELADGDVIEIPRRSDVVQVLGAVQSPGPVYYVPGYSASDYVERAGGEAPDADSNRAVVVSVSGISRSMHQVTEVNRGDVIIMASKHQVIQPPRQRSILETLGAVLGLVWIFRGL